jgi:predicted nucleic acid-binding protein
MALKKDFRGQRVYLDTNIIIYAVEEPSPMSAGQTALFEGMDDGSIAAITSELSLAECLVYPLISEDTKLASAYERFLRGGTVLELVPVDRHILIAAAHVRALTNVKLPDAIHVATAANARATVFLTGDKRIKAPAGLIVENWSRL